MSNFFYKAVFVAIIGVGLLSSQANAAGAKPVHQTYAGTGMDTQPGGPSRPER